MYTTQLLQRLTFLKVNSLNREKEALEQSVAQVAVSLACCVDVWILKNQPTWLADLGNLGIFPWFPNLQPKKKSAEPNNQINQLGIQMARAKSPTISSVAVPLRRIAVFFEAVVIVEAMWLLLQRIVVEYTTYYVYSAAQD